MKLGMLLKDNVGCAPEPAEQEFLASRGDIITHPSLSRILRSGLAELGVIWTGSPKLPTFPCWRLISTEGSYLPTIPVISKRDP